MSKSSFETRKTVGNASLSPSEEYGLLAADRRRLALDVLEGTTRPVFLDELAVEIATREDGIDADENTIDRVAISLHHNHLPKMSELGVLTYDPVLHRIVE